MPDRHARRDTNQSAFDKEYFDLIEETAVRIQQLDDTVDVTQLDRLIYDEIEWWKVPTWDDRLYYQSTVLWTLRNYFEATYKFVSIETSKRVQNS